MAKKVLSFPVIAKPTNIDEILESIGGFGKFQIWILALILSLEIPTSILVFVPVFIGAAPQDWLCDGIQVTKVEACSCAGNLSALDPTSSVVAEWNLVCGSAWVSDFIVSLQFSGMLAGNIIISQLSDWYGRRYCFLGITAHMALGTVITAVAPNYYVYGIARFICGASFSGFLSLTAVYAMEFLTPNWRPVASSVGPFGWGVMLLGVLAYYIHPWRTLVWVTAIPFAAVIFIFPFVPESPRWLLRNRKLEECHKVIGYMARLNGKRNVDLETLRFVMDKESPQEGTDQKKEIDIETPKDKSDSVERFSYLEFYRNSSLRKTTLCLQGLWFTWGVVYFGLSYNIRNLPGSPYVNIVYVGLTDAIGFPTAFVINNRFGRQKSTVIYMTICAISLVTIAVLLLSMDVSGYGTLLAVLTLFGRYCMAGARCALRTLTGESYPTALRVMGIGFAGSPASFGGALAPQLIFLGSYWPSLPYFGFAIIAVLGSLVSFMLREMKGKPLEDNIKAKTKTLRKAGGACATEESRKLSFGTIVPIAVIEVDKK